MKQAINLLSGVLLALGFGGSILVSRHSFLSWITILLILAILLSTALGAYWASRLRTVDVQKMKDAGLSEAVNDLMGGELKWLQGIRPRVHLINGKAIAASPPTEIIRKQYMSSTMLGIAILGGGALASIGLDPLSGRGLFGVLLATSAGRAIAVALTLYLLLSSASAYCAGLFLLNSRRK